MQHLEFAAQFIDDFSLFHLLVLLNKSLMDFVFSMFSIDFENLKDLFGITFFCQLQLPVELKIVF